VISHEMSHIKNYERAPSSSSVTTTLIGMAGLLAKPGVAIAIRDANPRGKNSGSILLGGRRRRRAVLGRRVRGGNR